MLAINIEDIFFDCSKVDNCDSLRNSFDVSDISFSSKDQLENIFADIAKTVERYDSEIQIDEVNGSYTIYIKFIPRPVIRKFDIKSNYQIDFTSLQLPREGEIYTVELVNNLKNDLDIFLKSKGFSSPIINVKSKLNSGEYNLSVSIDVGTLSVVTKVVIESDRPLGKDVETRLYEFKKQPWDKSRFEEALEKLSELYVGEGYYLFTTNLKGVNKLSDKFIEPVIDVKFGPKFAFDIRGNEYLSRVFLIKELKSLIIRLNGKINSPQIKDKIIDLYEDIGVFKTKVQIRAVKSSNDKSVVLYFVSVEEGTKYEVKDLSITGLKYFNEQEIKDLYKRKGSVLAVRKYYDQQYVQSFSEILRKEYLKHGFVFAKVVGPQIFFQKDNNSVKVEYRVVEGRQVKWSRYIFPGLSKDLYPLVTKNLKNRVKSAVNIIDLREDINKIETSLRDEGYYFAKIYNKRSKEIVQYSNDFRTAVLSVKINLGPQIKFNELKFLGLKKTNRKVIERELNLKTNEMITPQKVKELRDRLRFLGLFRTVEVTPIIIDKTINSADLLVKVVEKDFGFFELAPGFRSDIGFKLSSAVGYGNFFGLDHSLVMKGQVNERLNFSSFDERRSAERRRRIEYNASLNYSWPFFLDFPVNFSTQFSESRKRFRSYDADIRRVSTLFNFIAWESSVDNDNISFSVRPQAENIRQYDATDAADAGSFTVVTLTPGIKFDFRDRDVNPSKGAMFKFSYELARPEWGSKDSGAEIEYGKFVARNLFYYSPSNKLTFAFQFNTGVQKNFSTESKIPDIKVFRLTGVDRVRGFKDVEINRLNIPSLEYPDIDDVDVTDKVYFVNFKFEPRFYLSDDIILAPFYDAGRVMLDSYSPLDVRSSVGLSFKYVTPVGTLNFDYGFKFNRKIITQSGTETQEDSGRFHLSLGVF